MNYFTSDFHFNEKRVNNEFPTFIPFATTEEYNNSIVNNINSVVKETDTLYVLGDVSIDIAGLKSMDKIICKNRILISGNYDMDKLEELQKYFLKIYEWIEISIPEFVEIGETNEMLHLTHYPSKFKNDKFNLVGHIHGLWRVQKNMINVGLHAWNYFPVSEETILKTINAIRNYYDNNVFPNCN